MPPRKTWVTGETIDASELNSLEARSTVFSVTDPAYGALGNGTTNDTAAIQAAIDAAYSTNQGGVVHIPRSASAYMFSNLRLYANITLRGDGMENTVLKRISGSTGTAIREKTAAEGNPGGATGLWVSDLYLDGN